MKTIKLRANMRLYFLAGLLCLSAMLTACQTTQTVTTQSAGGRSGLLIDEKPKSSEERYNSRLQLAIAYYQGGAYDVALKQADEALSIKPRSGEALGLKGMIYAQLGDGANASEFLGRAIAVEPNNADLFHNLGATQCMNNNYMEGAANLERAVGLPGNSSPSRSWLVMGECYQSAGNIQKAETAFHQVLALEARNPAALYSLASIMYMRNDLDGVSSYLGRLGAPENMGAPALWLGVKVARQQGDAYLMAQYAKQLRERYPNSQEALAMNKGDYHW